MKKVKVKMKKGRKKEGNVKNEKRYRKPKKGREEEGNIGD